MTDGEDDVMTEYGAGGGGSGASPDSVYLMGGFILILGDKNLLEPVATVSVILVIYEYGIYRKSEETYLSMAL
jgi:hypothetical protein